MQQGKYRKDKVEITVLALKLAQVFFVGKPLGFKVTTIFVQIGPRMP
jgi:hypothetical protein